MKALIEKVLTDKKARSAEEMKDLAAQAVGPEQPWASEA